MKEDNMLDIIIEIFDEMAIGQDKVDPGQPNIMKALQKAGFETADIHKALQWLENFASLSSTAEGTKKPSHASIRIFSPEELAVLDVEAQAFILDLYNKGFLDDISRELVIDKVMSSAAGHNIEPKQLRWITVMVIANYGKEDVEPEVLSHLLNKQEHDVLH